MADDTISMASEGNSPTTNEQLARKLRSTREQLKVTIERVKDIEAREARTVSRMEALEAKMKALEDAAEAQATDDAQSEDSVDSLKNLWIGDNAPPVLGDHPTPPALPTILEELI